MHGQRPSYPNYAASPPLPHQPQAHFLSVPDADLGRLQSQRKGLIAGDDHLCCCFDSLASAAGPGSHTGENILLVGHESGLNVFRIEKARLEVVGRLEGLRGGVVAAKILPSVTRQDGLARSRPLVAVVVHGLDAPDPLHSSQNHGRDRPGDPSTAMPDMEQAGEVLHYRTTVEVYSLSRGEHLATLYATPPVSVAAPMPNMMFSPPPPIGGLQIHANGSHVVVASDVSGELFIYAVSPNSASAQHTKAQFLCLGKAWTALQPKLQGSVSASPNSPDPESHNWDNTDTSVTGPALVSLSHRWLAYVPTSRATASLDGTVNLAEDQPPPPGLLAHLPPPQPAATCEVDVPDDGGLLNRVTREVTQEFIKGARWVGDQGMQAWRNYWNKPSSAHDQSGAYPVPSQGRDHGLQPAQSSAPFFPPTHAHSSQPSTHRSEPTLVAILDLNKLLSSASTSSTPRLSPMATFPAPMGCSFLSFTPEGLMLLTASRKGDVQYVWDLMRVVHARASGASFAKPTSQHAAAQSPRVRQVARFSRMTVATLVDVVWTVPRGERLAIVTKRGTIHLFDMPSSAFQWPPPRRVARLANLSGDPKSEGALEKSDESTESVGNAVSAAFKMVAASTQPIMNAAQRRRGHSGTGVGAMSGMSFTSNGMQSGKYMAAGLSKSLGAASGTLNNLRKVRDTRIQIPPHDGLISPGRVRWLTGKEKGLLGVVGGGVLKIQSVEQGGEAKGGRQRSSTRGRAVEFPIPSADEVSISSPAPGWPQLEDDNKHGGAHDTAIWNLKATADLTRGSHHINSYLLSHAEIETNPPYQPFHTDRRVQLFAYEAPYKDGLQARRPSNQDAGQVPWAFGDDIPTRKLNVGPPPGIENMQTDERSGGPMENVLHVDRDEDEVEQIVITTRRRKRAKDGATEVDDGFFEDDCDVLDFASDRV